MRFAYMLLTLFATACGPKLVLPGGELRNPIAGDPVDDWEFSDIVQRVQLETRPDAPYSVHVFGVGSGSAFYVASQGWRLFTGNGGDARWVGYIADDPRVRLRVGKTLHELEAVRVDDVAELGHVQRLFQKKYGADAEKWGFWRSEDPAWVYRLDPR